MRMHHLKAPDESEVIFGQGTFSILAVEELYRAISVSSPSCKFGIAFAEGSGSRQIYSNGNSPQLTSSAAKELLSIGAGHTFLIFLQNAYPIHILANVKAIPIVLRIFAATANPVLILLHDEGAQSVVLGVADGNRPLHVEPECQRADRQTLVRCLGYLEPFALKSEGKFSVEE